jgi:hypothetical protein
VGLHRFVRPLPDQTVIESAAGLVDRHTSGGLTCGGPSPACQFQDALIEDLATELILHVSYRCQHEWIRELDLVENSWGAIRKPEETTSRKRFRLGLVFTH